MEQNNCFYFTDREDWRRWLSENFQTEKEAWLIYPNKASGKPRIVYNDAVEEALCFGWIDSIVKSIDEHHAMQRFTPRNSKSSYSQANKERIKWLAENDMIHPSVLQGVRYIIDEVFIFPEDIMAELKKDGQVWENYQKFSEPYKRVRIAWIDSARVRPEEYEKRLKNFIEKTRQGKMIAGYGGIGKYY